MGNNMYSTINPYDMTGSIDDSYGHVTIKTEVKIPSVKMIPIWSWVGMEVASDIPHNTKGPSFSSRTQCLWFVNGCQHLHTKEFSRVANHDDPTTLNWYLAYGDTLPTCIEDVRNLPVEYKS